MLLQFLARDSIYHICSSALHAIACLSVCHMGGSVKNA